MNILGISAYYHDSAACLVQDGKIISAAQEERFTRKKHDQSFPANAIESCLEQGGIKKSDLDIVAFYDKPFIKFERLLETYLSYAPLGIRSFIKAMPLWIKQKLWLKDEIKTALDFDGDIVFPEHHQSHAASAFFPSPFKQAAFLTIDGVGEWATTSYGQGRDNRIEIEAEIKFPHSLGLLYSAFTYHVGFKVNSGEYKLMGLAPYGKPIYKDLILSHLMDLKADGSFKMNMSYFDYCVGLTMTNSRFSKLFGIPPRKPEAKLTQQHMDLASSVQAVVEEVIMKMTKHIHKQTGQKNLCLAGGVAMNCVNNGKILRDGPFENIWIQPASGDAGGALGAALFAWYQYLGNNRIADGTNDFQQASLLGPKFDDDYIRQYLISNNITYSELAESDIAERIADLIAQQKVVGWFQGRMEFGPRALGSRSIIADCRSEKMQEMLNLKIKFRESFRPFAPSVLEEKAGDFFEIDTISPYMLLVVPVKKEICKAVDTQQENIEGLEKLKVVRSSIPAVTHVDYSARVQTVSKKDNPLFYQMLKKLNEKYDCPAVINTSFNVRGEPMVCTPADAYRCFMHTNMDYLTIGNFLLKKSDQKTPPQQSKPINSFELD